MHISQAKFGTFLYTNYQNCDNSLHNSITLPLIQEVHTFMTFMTQGKAAIYYAGYLIFNVSQ